MRILDDAYHQYRSGRMEEADWQVYENVIELAAGTSGVSFYVETRIHLHSQEFASLIKQKISDAQPRDKSIYAR